MQKTLLVAISQARKLLTVATTEQQGKRGFQMPVVYAFGQGTAEVPTIAVIRQLTSGVDNCIFRNTLLKEGIPVTATVGQRGCDKEFLHGIFIFTIKIISLRSARWKKAVTASPGAVVGLVKSRI